MGFTFQYGTTLVLTNGITSRELLVSSITASQTYLEESRSVKTIHTPNNIQDTFTLSKSPASVEFECHLTDSDDMLLEWFGFTKSSGVFTIPFNAAIPVLDIFIKANGTIYKISSAYATTLSVRMDKTSALSVAVSATGTNLVEVPGLSTPSLTVQNRNDFIHGSITIDGYSSVGGVTCEITKDIAWINDKTIHSILSGIHLNSKAVCQDLAVGGSITNYKRDSSLGQSLNTSVVITYAGLFKLSFDKCKTLDRWDMGDVHRKVTDYKLLPNSVNAFLQFLV